MDAGAESVNAAPDPADAAGKNNRRGRPRRLVWAPAIARPLGLKAQPVRVHVTNLSDTGVGFTAPRPLWPGQGITLTLIEPVDPAHPPLTYQIVYCRPVDKSFVVGAELVR